MGGLDAVVAVGGIDHVEGALTGADAAQPVVLQHGQGAHPDIHAVGGGVVAHVSDTGEAGDDRLRQDEVEGHQSHGSQQHEPGVEQHDEGGSGKEQTQPRAAGVGQDHADAHDAAADEVECPLGPGLGTEQAGAPQRDHQDEELAQHVGILQGGGHAEADGGEHIAVHPGGVLIAPAEYILADSVGRDNGGRDHHQQQQGIQLLAVPDGVHQHHGKQDEGHAQQAGLQTARHVHAGEGTHQIDGGVEEDVAVDGGIEQLALPVTDQSQRHGAIAHGGQSQHQHGGDNGGQHQRDQTP